MGDVVDFNGYTRLDIEPDKVLEGAKGKLDKVVVVGVNKDGEMWFSSSTSKLETILYLLKKAEKLLLEME